MCLDQIVHKIENHNANGTGFKCMLIHNNLFFGEYYNPTGSRRLGANGPIEYELNKEYEAHKPLFKGQIVGFHIFKTKEDALIWAQNSPTKYERFNHIVKVKWRHLIAEGTQQSVQNQVYKDLLTRVTKFMTITEQLEQIVIN